MSKKNCELCNKLPARMFCESDQASLCLRCDEEVHAANFLVAKHSRTLLCHVCRSPTAWSAQGPKLGLTVSLCHACSSNGRRRGGNTSNGSHSNAVAGGGNFTAEECVDDNDSYTEESDDDDDESVYDTENDGEAENQVVPWSEGGAKRARDHNFLESEDEDGCCSSQHIAETKSYEIQNSFQESDDDDDPSELRPSKKIRRRNDDEVISSFTSGREQPL